MPTHQKTQTCPLKTSSGTVNVIHILPYTPGRSVSASNMHHRINKHFPTERHAEDDTCVAWLPESGWPGQHTTDHPPKVSNPPLTGPYLTNKHSASPPSVACLYGKQQPLAYCCHRHAPRLAHIQLLEELHYLLVSHLGIELVTEGSKGLQVHHAGVSYPAARPIGRGQSCHLGSVLLQLHQQQCVEKVNRFRVLCGLRCRQQGSSVVGV